MTLKKRLFLSNMKILFLSLISLLAVIILVFVIFEDTIENKFFTMDQSKIDPNINKVQMIVESADLTDFTALEKQLNDLQYETCILKDGNITEGSSSENMLEIVNAFQSDPANEETISTYYYRNASVVVKYDQSEDTYIIASHFSSQTLKSTFKDAMWMWIIMIALIGIMVIAVLLFLSSIFTNRLNEVVMEPIDELMLASRRIAEGNLNEPIEYIGEEEFEQVTNAFNEMQKTILKNEEARIDMVTGISHDLRTPLTSIQGYIKGILDGIANTEEKKKQYLITAYDATKEMNVLLQKLFEFSKLESGQLSFHFLKVDLMEYIDHWITQKKDKAAFHFQHQDEPVYVSLDIDEFGRVLENLLENSMKYGNADNLKIDLSVEQTDRDVIFQWKDNGKGVSKDKIEHIFERFYRCDEARNTKGSGVGLYVVKTIMECHGGKVKAENENGLKFTFTFPIVR